MADTFGPVYFDGQDLLVPFKLPYFWDEHPQKPAVLMFGVVLTHGYISGSIQ